MREAAGVGFISVRRSMVWLREGNVIPSSERLDYGSFLMQSAPARWRTREATLTDVTHKYRPGDRVVFHPPPTLPNFAGAYVVERLLPISDNGPNYHIKRVKDEYERAASEHELTPATPSEPPKT
jgi:hypothetical protein